MEVVDRVVREVEGLEALDGPARPLAAAAGRVTRPRPVKNALSGTWLGHPLHPMLTDVPIGSWVAAGLLDLAGGAQAGRAARWPLDEGELADGGVRCPWHGSTFRLADGTAVRGPAASGQPAWQVRIEGEQVQVRTARR